MRNVIGDMDDCWQGILGNVKLDVTAPKGDEALLDEDAPVLEVVVVLSKTSAAEVGDNGSESER